jgi:hypothetical protein
MANSRGSQKLPPRQAAGAQVPDRFCELAPARAPLKTAAPFDQRVGRLIRTSSVARAAPLPAPGEHPRRSRGHIRAAAGTGRDAVRTPADDRPPVGAEGQSSSSYRYCSAAFDSGRTTAEGRPRLRRPGWPAEAVDRTPRRSGLAWRPVPETTRGPGHRFPRFKHRHLATVRAAANEALHDVHRAYGIRRATHASIGMGAVSKWGSGATAPVSA